VLENLDVRALPPGVYSLKLTRIEQDGRVTDSIIQFTLDNTPPAAALAQPQRDEYFETPEDEWIDVNDDVAGSLDSQLRFVPRADGFYYAQIKNVGDIGNQFVRYDLILEQCLPDTECGRAPEPAIGAPTGDDAAPVAGPGPDHRHPRRLGHHRR
jgi:hypothetical protein